MEGKTQRGLPPEILSVFDNKIEIPTTVDVKKLQEFTSKIGVKGNLQCVYMIPIVKQSLLKNARKVNSHKLSLNHFYDYDLNNSDNGFNDVRIALQNIKNNLKLKLRENPKLVETEKDTLSTLFSFLDSSIEAAEINQSRISTIRTIIDLENASLLESASSSPILLETPNITTLDQNNYDHNNNDDNNIDNNNIDNNNVSIYDSVNNNTTANISDNNNNVNNNDKDSNNVNDNDKNNVNVNVIGDNNDISNQGDNNDDKSLQYVETSSELSNSTTAGDDIQKEIMNLHSIKQIVEPIYSLCSTILTQIIRNKFRAQINQQRMAIKDNSHTHTHPQNNSSNNNKEDSNDLNIITESMKRLNRVERIFIFIKIIIRTLEIPIVFDWIWNLFCKLIFKRGLPISHIRILLSIFPSIHLILQSLAWYLHSQSKSLYLVENIQSLHHLPPQFSNSYILFNHHHHQCHQSLPLLCYQNIHNSELKIVPIVSTLKFHTKLRSLIPDNNNNPINIDDNSNMNNINNNNAVHAVGGDNQPQTRHIVLSPKDMIEMGINYKSIRMYKALKVLMVGFGFVNSCFMFISRCKNSNIVSYLSNRHISSAVHSLCGFFFLMLQLIFGSRKALSTFTSLGYFGPRVTSSNVMSRRLEYLSHSKLRYLPRNYHPGYAKFIIGNVVKKLSPLCSLIHNSVSSAFLPHFNISNLTFSLSLLCMIGFCGLGTTICVLCVKLKHCMTNCAKEYEEIKDIKQRLNTMQLNASRLRQQFHPALLSQ